MIYACFHEKTSPDTALCFGGEFSEASLLGNSCVPSERVLSILRLENIGLYDGSFAVNDVELLGEEKPSIKIIDTSLPLRRDVETGDYALNAALDKFASENGIRHAVAYRFRTIIQMVYADLQTKPLYLLLDLGGSRPEEQLLVTEFIAKVFLLGRILIHAPSISMNYHADLVPLSRIVADVFVPKQPALDMEHLAFGASSNEIAGIKPSVAGEIAQKEVPNETNPAKDPLAAQPQREYKVESNPSIFENEEKPAKRGFFGKIAAFFKRIPAPTMDLILNILFAVLCTGLAIAVCPINFAFSSEGSSTMLVVCIIVCFVFLIMAQIPIASIYQADKEQMNPFKAKPFMIVGVIFSLIGILAGVLMMVIGKSKGWDSSKALPFYIAYFLYPVFLTAYTAVTVYRKTHPKK